MAAISFTLTMSKLLLPSKPCCWGGQRNPNVPSCLPFPRAGHKTCFSLPPGRAPLASPHLLCRCFGGQIFIFWSEKHCDLVYFRLCRACRKGRSCPCPPHPPPLDLQSGGAQARLLLPAEPAGLGHGARTEPPQSLHGTNVGSRWWSGCVGSDCCCHCGHMAVAKHELLPGLRTAGLAAVPQGTPVSRRRSFRGGTRTGWLRKLPLDKPC